MTASEGGGPDPEAVEVPGRRAAITAAHVVTMAVSGVVALIALASVVVADGPRGSAPLGMALLAVSSLTVWVGWLSLRAFRETDHPRLLWMAAVGLSWMAVALVAPSA